MFYNLLWALFNITLPTTPRPLQVKKNCFISQLLNDKCFIIKCISLKTNTITFESVKNKFPVEGPLHICMIIHCKKSLALFPSPAGMSLTKPSLVGKN
jgi:hypothetical protein